MPSSASRGGSPRRRRASKLGKPLANRHAAADLARRAGVAVTDVDRLVALGFVSDRAGVGGSFTDADVRKVRFARSLEEGGLPLEDVAAAVRTGDISLDFLDSRAWQRFGAVGQATFLQASSETGIPLELPRPADRR